MKGPFPTSFLRRMASDQRKPLGKAGLLPEEVDDKAAKCREKVLQEQCESFLRRNDIFYLRMPMHRPTCVRCGYPDFTIFLPGGKAVLMEMKVEGGRVDKDQHILHQEYTRQVGGSVLIVINYDQFVRLMRAFLSDTSDAPPQTDSTSPSRKEG